jgi:DNA repair photolyase
MELLDKEIPKYKDKIKFVHLCFTTDPFMYGYPEVGGLSLKIIERFNKDNIRTTVLTKGVYPKDLAEVKKYGLRNEYGITVVSLDDKFKKDFEPFTAPYKERIKSLKYLHDKGLKTWISMEPYPTPNIVNQNLQKILKEVSFVDKIIFGKLNYNVDASKSVFRASQEFYEERANEVVDFCKEHDIEYHIKFGTQKKDNKTTGKIFVRNAMVVQESMCVA